MNFPMSVGDTYDNNSMTEYDKQNIDKILQGEGSWFTAHLLRLIAKADRQNRDKLRMGFPEEVAAYEKPTREERRSFGKYIPPPDWRDTTASGIPPNLSL
jgi:hypothetical protein